MSSTCTIEQFTITVATFPCSSCFTYLERVKKTTLRTQLLGSIFDQNFEQKLFIVTKQLCTFNLFT